MRLQTARRATRGVSAALAVAGALFGSVAFVLAATPTTTIGTSITTTGTISGDGSLLTNLSKSQVGLGNVPNVDATNPSNITADSTHRFVTDTEKTTWNGKLSLTGGTLTGALVLSADPTAALGAATKQYVDTGLSAKLNAAGNAVTATALAANPTDCGTDAYATAIAANGDLTCATITDGSLSSNVLLANKPSAVQFKDLIDSSINFVDDGLTTRKMAFQLSGITGGTTRVLTVPDASGTLLLNNSQLNGGNLLAGSVTATRLQATPLDLGAADVTVDLSNGNTSFATNLKLDGVASAAALQAQKMLGIDGGTLLRYDTFLTGGDYLTLSNADSSVPVTVGADGSDTNVSIRLLPKGAGSVVVGGDALRLPVHSVDPTGVTGMLYFNNTGSTLRCYNGTSWLDCALAGPYVVKGGNSFGSDLAIGTNDAFSLRLLTGGNVRLSIDAGGNASFSGDLQVAGKSFFQGDVTISSTGTTAAHLMTKQAVSPTIADDGDNASTLQAGSTDIAGLVVATTAPHTAVTVTFASTYGNPPFCVISPADASAAGDVANTFVTTTATAMVIHTAGARGEAHTYHCIGGGGVAAVVQGQ